MSDFAGMTVIFCRNDTSDSVDNFVEIEDFLTSWAQNYPHVILSVSKDCKSNCMKKSKRIMRRITLCKQTRTKEKRLRIS